ncbi:MAG: OsmC family protein [bacterium]
MTEATIPQQAGDTDAARWVAATVGATYRADVTARMHSFAVDEPVALGGTDAGATPYEYLLGALSSCMAMTLRLYANRKGWPLEKIVVQMRTARSHEADCENCATAAVGITRIERKVELHGPLNDEQRARLMQIADRCPVKQTLEHGIAVESVS